MLHDFQKPGVNRSGLLGFESREGAGIDSPQSRRGGATTTHGLFRQVIHDDKAVQ